MMFKLLKKISMSMIVSSMLRTALFRLLVKTITLKISIAIILTMVLEYSD